MTKPTEKLNNPSGSDAAGRAETAALLDWYDRTRRILPWREDPTPYHIWLSEIMLQQTRVDTVTGFYERFLAACPDIAALAAADEPTCLKLWEGLGYYSRVRNMRKAAAVIMEQYEGRLPESAAELSRLPGIGRYTSRAIASIAFGEPVPAVDGNLLRVFSRKTRCAEDISDPATKKAAEAYYAARIPEDRPGDYNQALMDLGATVCVPNGDPLCGACPWQDCCAAHRAGRETEFPVTAKKTKRRVEHRTILIIVDDERVLLTRRPDHGLLAGLYEFPNVPGSLTKAGAERAAYAILDGSACTPVSPGKSDAPGAPDGAAGSSGDAPRILGIRRAPASKHLFTHLEWHMTGYIIRVGRVPDRSGSCFGALRSEIKTRFALPSAIRIYARLAAAEN